MAIPLKINNAGGTEIKQFTTAEENYIAYQIGLHLAADSANGDGTITSNSAHTSIGSYTNTFFNEAVGTHPSTSITSGSTTTTVYQNQTSAIETDSDIEIPLMWIDSGGQTGFKQMTAADLNNAVDRYLSTIFTNDYPGTFKLASSSPGPDYSVHLSSVFTDTRTDGTAIAYNIYRRDSYTAPTAVQPLYVRDNGGFDGIQAMNDRQIKYSFGQRAKTRIGASKIGTYQLRTSAQGAPTDPGTWVAAGAATDTKQTTADVVYLRDSTTNFTAQYTKNYTKQYTSVYIEPYTRAYTSAFTTNYERLYEQKYNVNYITINNDGTPGYTNVRTVQYLQDGIGIRNYIGSTIYYVNIEYTSISIYTNSGFIDDSITNTYQGPSALYIHPQFEEPYVSQNVYLKGLYNDFGQQVIQYGSSLIYENIVVGYENGLLYDKSFEPGFSDYIGGTGPYDSEPRGYLSTYSASQYIPDTTFYQNIYTDTYARTYEGTYVGNYDATNFYDTFTRPISYIGAPYELVSYYTKEYTSQYIPPTYTGRYTGTVIGKIGYYTKRYTGQIIATYTRSNTYATQGVLPRYYTAFLNYRAPRPRFYQGSAGTTTSGFQYYTISAVYTGALVISNFYQGESFYSGGGPAVGYIQNYERAYTQQVGYDKKYTTASISQEYATDYTGGAFPNTSYYITGGYTGIQTTVYSGNTFYIPNYELTELESYNRAYSQGYDTTGFVGNYQGDTPGLFYTASFLGTYVPTTYANDYTGNYLSLFYIANYEGKYAIDYQGLYENIYTSLYEITYSSNYTTEFLNFFDSQYQQDYLGNFEGNFAGETIQATSQTEETYTLYVRIG